MGNPSKNFDKELRMRKGAEQYRLDKSKAGRCGSSAGQPRPYAKANMQLARLSAPHLVGSFVYVTPRKSFGKFKVGHLYRWEVSEEGYGMIEGCGYTAKELISEFIIVPKGKVIC